MKEIVIATQNKHKIVELKKMLEPLGYTVFTLLDYPDVPEIVEDGYTFRMNAFKKAQTLSNIIHKDVVADDSGLEVIALNNEPGIYSARYAGEGVSYEDNNALLIKNMVGIKERDARFVTTICLVRLQQEPLYFEGYLNGFIAEEYKGENGFGYDPIFKLEDGRHLAELTLEEKNIISHRAQSMSALIKYLKTIQ